MESFLSNLIHAASANDFATMPSRSRYIPSHEEAYTPAIAQTMEGTRSAASRSAACRADCSTDGLHGFYRTRAMDNPTPLTTTWGEIYSICVRTCLAPLPPVYIQRSILESGGDWFGKSASSCLGCHAQGSNLRLPGTINRGNVVSGNPDTQ